MIFSSKPWQSNLIPASQFRNLLLCFSSYLLGKPPGSINQPSTSLWNKIKSSFYRPDNKPTNTFYDSISPSFKSIFLCTSVGLDHNSCYSFGNFFNCWISPYSNSINKITCPFAFLNFLRWVLINQSLNWFLLRNFRCYLESMKKVFYEDIRHLVRKQYFDWPFLL